MADDERVAKRKLENLLTLMRGHRRDLVAYLSIGDFSGVARCEQLLKVYYSRIREHCAEHHLELPHDAPSEGAE